jgi:hypothetical protein
VTMSLAAWRADVEGKTIGSGECVALTNDYNLRVVGSPPVPTTGDNYAITQLESFPLGGLDKFYVKVSALGPFKAGDQIFWNRGSGYAPVSHTAVVVADLGPAIQIESQNTNGHRYAETTTGPRAGVAGALRPINPASIDGVGITLASDTSNPVDALTALAGTWGKVVAWLGDGANWQRIGLALLGIILIMIALGKILKFNPVTALTKATP